MKRARFFSFCWILTPPAERSHLPAPHHHQRVASCRFRSWSYCNCSESSSSSCMFHLKPLVSEKPLLLRENRRLSRTCSWVCFVTGYTSHHLQQCHPHLSLHGDCVHRDHLPCLKDVV